MPQNLKIIRKSSACTDMAYLLRSGNIGFRLLRYQCFLWFGLAIVQLQLLFASEEERSYLQIRYFRLITRIDFVGVYELVNDWLW